MSKTFFVLPRPGTGKPAELQQPISAPSEVDFIATFGNLLPPASYVSTENGRVAFYELPPSSIPPLNPKRPVSRVVFLHGARTPAVGLEPLASALSSRFPYAQCVLVDFWGHGLTDTPVAPHDPVLFHALLEALMSHLGWNDAHIVGYSFGASMAASFAARKPECVASMVLLAPAGLTRSTRFGELQTSYLRGGDGLEEQAQAWILRLLDGGQLVVPPDWKERTAKGTAGALDQHAEFAKAAETGVKYLCIRGELDHLSTVQDLHDVGMRNVVVVPRVGHGIVRECVPEVSRLIEEFWKKLEQSSN
ncbi:hypothetical protein NM208_g2770 [Fusarium decemcellulare]|uniref:Uncharacterized protein n=1 Tax=Fusarium decemcellulare TaxID=57161 RepID=A0ACC1SRH8_9HYPO|nr:hypothetical protein NM208_g2770 [Fusarium decemcellulare]